ncbi:MAG: hypothetical protein ACE5GW_00625 [Planctomycetota bacterium]
MIHAASHPARWLPLLLLLAAGGPLFAQPNPDFVLSVPSTTVEEGREVTISVSFDNDVGGPVDWLALGICSDPLIVAPIAAEEGSAIPGLNGGAGPEFFGTALFPDGVTMGLIVSFIPGPTLPPAPDHELLKITYDAIGPVGDIATLQFCDGLGGTNTIVVVGGGSLFIDPETIDGQIEVVPAATAILELVLDPSVPRGGTLPVSVIIGNNDPIEGFRLGLAHDPAFLGIVTVTPGSIVLDTNGGAGPDLFSVDVSPAGGTGLTVECIISTQAPIDAIPVGIDEEIVAIEYDVIAAPGLVCSSTSIAFADTFGDPAVPVEVTVAGAAEIPTTVDGELEIVPTLPVGATGGFTLRAASVQADAGETVVVPVVLDNEEEVQAFSFGLAHDATDVTLAGISQGFTVAESACGAGAEYFATLILNGSPAGGAVACILRLQPPFTDRVISPGSENEVATLEYTISDNPSGSGTTLDFVGTLSTPPVAIEVTVGGQAVQPVTVSGAVTLGVRLVRGDCNTDGINNIADAVFILGYLFPPGGGPGNAPACFDACDGNDDGALNLGDAVALLSSLFADPVIPLPEPSVCSSDPTADSLDCALFAPCP